MEQGTTENFDDWEFGWCPAVTIFFGPPCEGPTLPLPNRSGWGCCNLRKTIDTISHELFYLFVFEMLAVAAADNGTESYPGSFKRYVILVGYEIIKISSPDMSSFRPASES
jgi:hypothetical protein